MVPVSRWTVPRENCWYCTIPQLLCAFPASLLKSCLAPDDHPNWLLEKRISQLLVKKKKKRKVLTAADTRASGCWHNFDSYTYILCNHPHKLHWHRVCSLTTLLQKLLFFFFRRVALSEIAFEYFSKLSDMYTSAQLSGVFLSVAQLLTGLANKILL